MRISLAALLFLAPACFPSGKEEMEVNDTKLITLYEECSRQYEHAADITKKYNEMQEKLARKRLEYICFRVYYNDSDELKKFKRDQNPFKRDREN